MVTGVRKRSSLFQRWILPDDDFALMSIAYPVDQTGWAFLFLLTVSLIEKGQKRNNQTSKGYQQANNPNEY